MTMQRQNTLLSIGASLGLHGLAAVILIFGLSGHAMIPQNLNTLDFVWVSIAAKDKAPSPPVAKTAGKNATFTDRQGLTAPEMPAIRNLHLEPQTSPSDSDKTAPDGITFASGTKTTAQAEADGRKPVSDTVRMQAPSGAPPVFSTAYPRYRENPPPGYPEMARQRGYEGVVLVAAEILTDGRVGKAWVRQSSGYAILDQTAVAAVKDWKFVPAKKSGIPYKTWAELPIKFVISEKNSHS